MAKYTPKTKEELQELIKDESIYLGDIDTSVITDMSSLFAESERKDFSGIELWDTSNVTTMKDMFGNAEYFNHNINSWDTSNVIDMSFMFYNAKNFNQSLGSWDTSSVINMANMFNGACNFNQPLDSWDTSSVISMSKMFWDAKNFNQPLDSWDTSNVEFMTRMFRYAKNFNQNLNSWDISSVEDNQQMFWDSGVESLPKWWEKRIVKEEMSSTKIIEPSMSDEIERIHQAIKQALENPHSKEERQKEKEQSQAQKQEQLQEQVKEKAQPTAKTKKPFYTSTLFLCIVGLLIGVGFGIFKSNTRAQKQSASITQTQQPQQNANSQQKPALITPKCNDSAVLADIKNAQRQGIRDTIEKNADLWANIQKRNQTKGAEFASVAEYVSGMRLDYSGIETNVRDEVKHRVECSARLSVSHSLMPKPQIWEFQYSIQATGQNNNINISNYKQINSAQADTASESVNLAENSAQSVPSQNIQASFDCAKASTRVERLICSDSELASLDIELSQAYANARNSLDAAGKKALLSEQRKWLEAYNQCDDKPCVLHNMQIRIKTLQSYGGKGLRLKTNDEYVNLRQSPSGEIITAIYKSDFDKITLQKLETNGKWVKVRYVAPNQSEMIGYIHISQIDESSL